MNDTMNDKEFWTLMLSLYIWKNSVNIPRDAAAFADSLLLERERRWPPNEKRN